MERTRVNVTVLTADLCAIYGCDQYPGVGLYEPDTMRADNGFEEGAPM